MRKLVCLLLLALFPLLVGWQDNTGWKQDSQITDLTFAPAKNLTDSATPEVSGFTYFQSRLINATNNVTNFTASDLQEGKVIVVHSRGAITYDVTSSSIVGGSADLTTQNGDITTFVWTGGNWTIMSRINASADLN